MKNPLPLFTLILLVTTSISKAQDYVWGEEFKEGDVISAATFNQIFDTLQKLNRTPVDADLVGTWNCSAVEKLSNNAQNVNGWSKQGFLWVLPAKQVTMTASGDNSSVISPYSLSTEAPSPFYVSNNASTGTYSLFNGMLFLNGVVPGTIDQYYVDIISDDRFVLQGVTSGGFAVPDFIICDSAIAFPAAPSATTATNAQTLVNITWTDNSADETGFKIYRRLSTETEATELATAVTASPYSDSTLTEGQTAYYSVAAYNDNGVSGKSKVVSVTLDSIKPSVASHTPTANQQVAKSSTTISITFSENITIKCHPSAGDCNSGYAFIVSSEQHPGNTLPYGTFTPISGYGSVVTGTLDSFDFYDGDTVTVTIIKEWIQDIGGNTMDADYTYSFTTGS